MALHANEDVRNWQNRTVENLRGRKIGRYMGFVKDVDDPEKRGRIRAFVPSLVHGNGNTEQSWLGWANPGSDGLNVPPVGETVWVTFEMGIISDPIYILGWFKGENDFDSDVPKAGKEEEDPTWKDSASAAAAGQPSGSVSPALDISATVPQDTAKDTVPQYPFNKVMQTTGGHITEIDDSLDNPRARYQHPSGTSILVDPDGSVHIRAQGSIYNECRGDYVVKLRPGSTYKVIYNEGTSMSLGASGFLVRGHQAHIIGRVVVKNGEHI